MKNEILEIISNFAEERIEDETQDLVIYGVDSFKKVTLIIEIEDHFKIRFADSDLNPAKLNTVKDFIELTMKYLKGGGENVE